MKSSIREYLELEQEAEDIRLMYEAMWEAEHEDAGDRYDSITNII